MKVVVTGAGGLLGWHAACRLRAANAMAQFRNEAEPFTVVALDRSDFNDQHRALAAFRDADAVLHFAGVNRAPDADIEDANLRIAEALLASVNAAGAKPHIVYANSTHAEKDTPYGRSKRRAGEAFGASGLAYTDLVLPHIFGECARPFYNNVTATLCRQVIDGATPSINPDGRVELLHAGAAAQSAIDAVVAGKTGRQFLAGKPVSVPDLHQKIAGFHQSYLANIVPDLSDPFDVALFNSYRAALYPDGFPRPLTLNTDPRGTLFEAVKGGGGRGGQTFLSWTEPGITRGDHFHLDKVERFLVVSGEAVIRIRRVLTDTVWEYRVSGERPAAVDMPTLHTHSIENVGEQPLLTLFWTNEIFDPAAPDTYRDRVLPDGGST